MMLATHAPVPLQEGVVMTSELVKFSRRPACILSSFTAATRSIPKSLQR